MTKGKIKIPGLTFTGDIHIQGDMFNIHDNQNVYFTTPQSPSESEDHVKDEPQKVRNKGGRPKRAGKKINKAFIYDAGDETNKRLQLLYNGLKALNWIREDSDLKNFMSLFSGGETSCRVVWTGEVNALTELFKELVTRKKLVKLPKGTSIWVMVNARFWEKEGNKEFGNDRLAATRAPIDKKKQIDLLVKLMDPKVPLEQMRRVAQSQG